MSGFLLMNLKIKKKWAPRCFAAAALLTGSAKASLPDRPYACRRGRPAMRSSAPFSPAWRAAEVFLSVNQHFTPIEMIRK
jgi:hypothetical protein